MYYSTYVCTYLYEYLHYCTNMYVHTVVYVLYCTEGKTSSMDYDDGMRSLHLINSSLLEFSRRCSWAMQLLSPIVSSIAATQCSRSSRSSSSSSSLTSSTSALRSTTTTTTQALLFRSWPRLPPKQHLPLRMPLEVP